MWADLIYMYNSHSKGMLKRNSSYMGKLLD